jgi:hypothetical protein
MVAAAWAGTLMSAHLLAGSSSSTARGVCSHPLRVGRWRAERNANWLENRISAIYRAIVSWRRYRCSA